MQAQQQQPPAPHLQQPGRPPPAGPGHQPARPVQPATAPAAAVGGGGSDDWDDEEDELDGLDVDQLIQEHARRAAAGTQQAPTQVLPAQAVPTQYRAAAGPGPGAGQASYGGRPGLTQQPAVPPGNGPSQRPGAGPAHAQGPACSHGVPYVLCQQRQAHLAEIKDLLAGLAQQLVAQLTTGSAAAAATQQRIKELGELQKQLEQAPPPPLGQAQAGGQPLPPLLSGNAQALGAQPAQQQPYQHAQQPYQQPHYQQPNPGGGAFGGGVQPSQQAGGYGGGLQAGPPLGQQQPGYGWGAGGGPPGGYGGAGGGPSGEYGGLGGGGFGTGAPSAGGNYGGPASGAGGGGAGYDSFAREVVPMVPWEPDQEALRNVRAERVDGSSDKRWAVGLQGSGRLWLATLHSGAGILCILLQMGRRRKHTRLPAVAPPLSLWLLRGGLHSACLPAAGTRRPSPGAGGCAS